MIKTYKTVGIILNQKNFFEADRVLTIFTRDFGRLRLLAKAVRKPSSRKRGHLEQFNLTKLVIIKTKSIDLIIEAETINSFSHLRQNLNRVRIAYLLCELINDLTAEGQEHVEVYQLLLNNLTLLNSAVASKNLILNFEKSLLTLLGFGLPEHLSRASLEFHIQSITDKPLNSKKIK